MTTGTIAELRRLKAANKEFKTPDIQAALRLIGQAEVSADLLTGSDVWNRFLSYLTEAFERLEGIESGLKDSLASLKIISHDDIMGLKIELASVQGRLDMLASVMMLPKDIMEAAEGVKPLKIS